MRNLKVMVTGLALAGLAGCGTAWASESRPTWVAPSSASADRAADRDAGRDAEEPADSSTDGSTSDGPTSEGPTTDGSSADGSSTDGSSAEQPGPDSPSDDTSPSSGSTPSASEDASSLSEEETAPDPESSPSEAATSHPASAHHGGPANSLMKTGEAGVALTFDDGPDPVQTPKLLDLLAEEGVKGTFCLVGQQAAAHPDLVRRIAEEGHTLCNHTWNHSLTLGKESPDTIRTDLEKTNEAIHAAVPDAEITFMRAPGGNFTPAFVEAATELGMTSIYWQVDTRDWEHPAGESGDAHVARVIKTVKQQTGAGSIVLSHDFGQPGTITAYKTLLPWLKERFELIALR
ncbi:polysaccharide deacetylase family protein [Actinoplanes sp. NPDC051494]|uniref:polysaccharide deacetylase family protein n=1 Tax=Actinoplanes sp. NPDC051494 TaxID=3363907 RepID=UPI0037A1BBDA